MPVCMSLCCLFMSVSSCIHPAENISLDLVQFFWVKVLRNMGNKKIASIYWWTCMFSYQARTESIFIPTWSYGMMIRKVRSDPRWIKPGPVLLAGWIRLRSSSGCRIVNPTKTNPAWPSFIGCLFEWGSGLDTNNARLLAEVIDAYCKVSGQCVNLED